jgi:hypothetical protein
MKRTGLLVTAGAVGLCWLAGWGVDHGDNRPAYVLGGVCAVVGVLRAAVLVAVRRWMAASTDSRDVAEDLVSLDSIPAGPLHIAWIDPSDPADSPGAPLALHACRARERPWQRAHQALNRLLKVDAVFAIPLLLGFALASSHQRRSPFFGVAVLALLLAVALGGYTPFRFVWRHQPDRPRSYGMRTDAFVFYALSVILFAVSILALCATQNWPTAIRVIAAAAAAALYSVFAVRALQVPVPPHPTRQSELAPRTLLALRVFGSPRTRTIVDGLGDYWMWVGPLWIIGARDSNDSDLVQTEQLDVGKMFEILFGHRFVKTAAEADAFLGRLSTEPTQDGHFDHVHVMCNASSWTYTFRRLLGRADRVLIDLSGYSKAHQGCAYELSNIIQTVEFERVVVVVDGRTDRTLIETTLRDAWASRRSGSKNAADPAPTVRVLRLHKKRSRREIEGLLVALLKERDYEGAERVIRVASLPA